MTPLVLTLALVLSQGQSAPVHPPDKPNSASAAEQATAKPGIADTQPKPGPKEPTADDRIASYTGWLTVFTAVLAVGTLGLFWVAWRQGKQIEREFTVAHRPRLRLRRIYFAGSTDPLPMTRITDAQGRYTEILTEGAPPPRVIIEMANVGGVGVAKAKLYVTFTIFKTGHPEPGKIQYELARAIPQKMEVSHAGSGVLDVGVPAIQSLFADAGVLSGSQSVYCVGYVEYSDETETLGGRTGFIRRCDVGNRWFEAVRFPDFEYAD